MERKSWFQNLSSNNGDKLFNVLYGNDELLQSGKEYMISERGLAGSNKDAQLFQARITAIQEIQEKLKTRTEPVSGLPQAYKNLGLETQLILHRNISYPIDPKLFMIELAYLEQHLKSGQLWHEHLGDKTQLGEDVIELLSSDIDYLHKLGLFNVFETLGHIENYDYTQTATILKKNAIMIDFARLKKALELGVITKEQYDENVAERQSEMQEDNWVTEAENLKHGGLGESLLNRYVGAIKDYFPISADLTGKAGIHYENKKTYMFGTLRRAIDRDESSPDYKNNKYIVDYRKLIDTESEWTSQTNNKKDDMSQV